MVTETLPSARAPYIIALVAAVFLAGCAAQAAPANVPVLRMVVIMSRHGVRSPSSGSVRALRGYSSSPWPTWSVKPEYLTSHGAALMRELGSYYRNFYGTRLGLGARGCPPNGSVFVWADVDERTRATGEAIVQGFAPDCAIAVRHATGREDTLFDPQPRPGSVDEAESNAALLGAVGGNLEALTEAFAPAFATLERVLGCAPNVAGRSPCKEISQVPTTVVNARGGQLASVSGGLDMASDAAENLLLAYTDGHADVGWGRIDHAALVQLLALHVLSERLEHNRYASQVHSSNILTHILQTLQEGERGMPVSGTRVPLKARFVFFSGHDTQEAEFAGILGLSWLVPGDQLDDTSPGSAIVFELYASPDGSAFVRTYFIEQSLDDMRAGNGAKPLRVPIYVPGCPGFDCPFAAFSRIVTAAVDPSFVRSW